MLQYGQDALKQQVLRRLLTDDLAMCLLYSEPGAGSTFWFTAHLGVAAGRGTGLVADNAHADVARDGVVERGGRAAGAGVEIA